MLNTTNETKAVVVDRPRTSDAVGMVLRDAYEREFGLPDDFAVLLRRLNGNDGRCATTIKP